MLNDMDLGELKSLKKQIENSVDNFEKRRASETIEQMNAIAKSAGYSSAKAVFEAYATGKGGTKSPIKYRHPEDETKTWTGRGRIPQWIHEHEENGGSREDFLLEKQQELAEAA